MCCVGLSISWASISELMSRLDFMNCPLCSGHEKIGAEAAIALDCALSEYLGAAGSTPVHIETELMNIRNAIANSQEPRVAPATSEESWLDA